MINNNLMHRGGDVNYPNDINNDEEIKKAIEDFFRPFASGNEGYVRLEGYEPTATNITFDCLIRHKHVQVIAGQHVTVYAMISHAKGIIDLIDPDKSTLDVCFDSPVGQICVNIRTLIEIILVILA